MPIIIKISSASSKAFCQDSNPKSHEGIKMYSDCIHGLVFHGLAFHIRELGSLKMFLDSYHQGGDSNLNKQRAFLHRRSCVTGL